MSAAPDSVATPGSSGAPPGKLRRGPVPAILLIVVVLLLGFSLVLPWWSETQQSPGPNGEQSTQNYSPLTGVTGSCSPACSPFEPGPPLGPIQGTRSFSSVGLNRTATLYYAGVGLVLNGLVGGALALITLPTAVAPPSRQIRFHTAFLTLALLASAGASAAVACLQPIAFQGDVSATLSPNSAWTASPSPETSFWGSCVPGPTNGICASGWSVAWGPGPGWYLITMAAVVVMVVLLLRMRRGRVPPPPATG